MISFAKKFVNDASIFVARGFLRTRATVQCVRQNLGDTVKIIMAVSGLAILAGMAMIFAVLYIKLMILCISIMNM